GGLIESDSAGRTDRVPLAVGTDAHVIPADVVSGLGQGNTLAGAKILDAIFGSGPDGAKLPRSGRGAGVRMPGLRESPMSPEYLQRLQNSQSAYGYAKGGDAHAHIIAAGGEYIVPPERVRAKGKGSMAKGHKLIDQLIRRVRDMQKHFLKHAPAPKK
ncbi:MAG: hypothetical protein KGL35_22890, partial [Bradyrhizobium sp.]|nr:hypothetical protein [Bradyrhizobium sp.]